MVAEKTFPYRGKLLKKGDAFVVTDATHQRQLRGARLASDYKSAKKEKQAVAAEPSGMGTARPIAIPEKKSDAEYKTRALKAED